MIFGCFFIYIYNYRLLYWSNETESFLAPLPSSSCPYHFFFGCCCSSNYFCYFVMNILFCMFFSSFSESGMERRRIVSQDDRRKLAIHEAGHAVLGWHLEHIDTMLKVSLVPRGNSIGYSQYLPSDNKLHSTEQVRWVKIKDFFSSHIKASKPKTS